MMYGRGFYGAGSCGVFGPLMMIGFVLLIAILVFFLLKANKSKAIDSNAGSILKEKFAKGEITEEEYLSKKNLLERR